MIDFDNIKRGDSIWLNGSRYIVGTIMPGGFWTNRATGKRAAYWFSKDLCKHISRHVSAADFKPRKKADFPVQIVRFVDGKAAGEDNDCTVIAVCQAFDIPYDRAHELLQIHAGRKPRKGCSMTGYLNRMREGNLSLNGYKPIEVEYRRNWSSARVKGMTIQQLMTSGLTKYRMIVTISGHAAAIVNGKWIDSWKPGARSVIASITLIVPVGHVFKNKVSVEEALQYKVWA